MVPNFEAPGMRRSCTEDIPRHLWLFSPRAVSQYLQKFGMELQSIRHDGSIYSSYPFGLLRQGLLKLWKDDERCSRYDNKSVALLRNRQVRGNVRAWLAEVFDPWVRWTSFLMLRISRSGIVVAQFSNLSGTTEPSLLSLARSDESRWVVFVRGAPSIRGGPSFRHLLVITANRF